MSKPWAVEAAESQKELVRGREDTELNGRGAGPGLEAEDPFRTLAESLPLLAWMAEGDGSIVWYNRRWYEYTGTTFDQMAGWGWKTVHDPVMLDQVVAGWTASLRTGTAFEMEFPLRRHDGVFRWFLTRVNPLRNAEGTVVRWIGTNTDIEDQRRAAQRARFLAEAGVVLGAGGDIEQTMADLARLLVPAVADWYAVDELAADGQLHRLAVAHPDPAMVDLAWDLWRKYPPRIEETTVLRTGVSELYPDIPQEMLDASARDAEHLAMIRKLALRSAIVVPLKARDRVFGMITLVAAESGRRFDTGDVAFAEDIALRAGAAIDNARTSAARDAAEQERELAMRALERSNRELDQFAYVTSHDLKAPLRGIANLSQWVEEDLGERMTPEAREQMALLRGRVHRLEALIDGILSYSRAGRSREKSETVDVGKLVDDVVELLAPVAGAAVEITRPLPVLQTERVPLQQVFMNLVSNGLKYAQRKDARVRVTSREVNVTGTGDWEFSVADNGPGIAEEYHERIWGIFQTLASRDKVEGTGIGLSVVKKIVESRGGRVWVESSEGAGAVFRFTWPRQSKEALAERHGGQGDQHPARGR